MKMSRAAYARLFGPTTGDRVRLGDTSLLAEVEQDLLSQGDELSTGAGKTMRDGEGFKHDGTDASGALDCVIHNAVVLDPVLGILKTDIGIRRGRIVALGKAGNPDVMENVHPDLVCGPNTTVIHGDHMFVTPGIVEAHAHFLSPQQAHHALAGGCTTMIGMSPGPHFDTSCSGPETLGRLIQACDEYPLNFGFLGRGASNPDSVDETVAGGALGVKIHEDLGASPAVIDGSLIAADRADFSVHIHTDTLNEFGFAEDTMAAAAGRLLHMYHTEGAGGGHAPDILVVNGWENVLPSSTNPTNPFTKGALEEGLPMTMLCHMLSFDLPEDVAIAANCVFASTNHEFADKGIRAFGFAPGVVDTDMQGIIRASGINPVSKLKRSDLAPAHAPARAMAPISWPKSLPGVTRSNPSASRCRASVPSLQKMPVATPAALARPRMWAMARAVALSFWVSAPGRSPRSNARSLGPT